MHDLCEAEAKNLRKYLFFFLLTAFESLHELALGFSNNAWQSLRFRCR